MRLNYWLSSFVPYMTDWLTNIASLVGVVVIGLSAGKTINPPIFPLQLTQRNIHSRTFIPNINICFEICQIVDGSASSYGVSIIFWPVETGYFDKNRWPAAKEMTCPSIPSRHVKFAVIISHLYRLAESRRFLASAIEVIMGRRLLI
jgi:hypothetical protein